MHQVIYCTPHSIYILVNFRFASILSLLYMYKSLQGNLVITPMHEILHAKVYILARMQFSPNTFMFSTKYFCQTQMNDQKVL